MKENLVAERFIRTLKNKSFKHMTAISKNIYFDALDNVVNKYNNTVLLMLHLLLMLNTMNMLIKKDPKFKVGDYVRISKYKNIFC